MRALASSLGAWESIERNQGTVLRHGLTFALAVVGAIGKPHGLDLEAEEHSSQPLHAYQAVFVSVYDARTMMNTRAHFDAWGMPMHRKLRSPFHPLVWAGGQGLHNPMPYYDIADLIVVGDAEDPLPALLRLWTRHGNTDGFLRAAADVPGVLVPKYHRPGEARIKQAVASDVAITVREAIRVNHTDLRRIEIARNCKHKCLFCGLGWRAPYRENAAAAIVSAIESGGRSVHLQAGDAESHSGIATLRAALQRAGARDGGWTGRLDTTSGSDEIAGSKRYAFGVEGMTHRVRRATGKGWLTDDRLVSETAGVMSRIEGESKGRTCWHMIAGLPGETHSDALHFMSVLQRLNDRVRGKTPRNLALHWQPFQPLPGTPMQWQPCGSGARRIAAALRPMERMPWVRVRQQTGRTDDVARLCTVLARADARAVDVLARIPDVSADDAAQIAGTGYGAIDPDAPLPWDWIDHAYPRPVLRRGHDAVRRMLDER
jgi:hypothetical protein